MSHNLDFGDDNKVILLRKVDDTVVKIKPTNWINIDKVMNLLETLLTEYLLNDGTLGNVFRPKNKTTWDAISALLDLHPLVAGENLSLEDLHHLDVDELKSLFITRTGKISESGERIPEDKTIVSSMIGVINSLDFLEILRAGNLNRQTHLESLTEQT